VPLEVRGETPGRKRLRSILTTRLDRRRAPRQRASRPCRLPCAACSTTLPAGRTD